MLGEEGSWGGGGFATQAYPYQGSGLARPRTGTREPELVIIIVIIIVTIFEVIKIIMVINGWND